MTTVNTTNVSSVSNVSTPKSQKVVKVVKQQKTIKEMKDAAEYDVKLAEKYIRKRKDSLDRGIGFNLTFQSYKNLPYQPGNVVACCHGFNQMKAAMERDGSIFFPVFKKGVIKMFKELESRGNMHSVKRNKPAKKEKQNEE